jgi:hypothetical protein
MKKPFYIVEIIIWTLLISLLLYGGIALNQHLNPTKTFEVKFGDVDGLAVGAPVNFMGVYVGVIKALEIKDSKVFVTFSVKDKKFDIPPGSRVGIQFTGLVGSKTLEIEPPLTPGKTDQQFITKDPIRIGSFIEIMAKTSESVAKGSANFLDMLGGNKTTAQIKDNIWQVSVVMYKAASGADSFEGKMTEARHSMQNALYHANSSVSNYLNVTNNIVATMNTTDYDEDTKAILRYTKYTLLYFYRHLVDTQYKSILSDVTYAGNALNRRFNFQILDYFKKYQPETVVRIINEINCQIIKYGMYFEKGYCKLGSTDFNQIFCNIIDKTETIKDVTEKMENAI